MHASFCADRIRVENLLYSYICEGNFCFFSVTKEIFTMEKQIMVCVLDCLLSAVLLPLITGSSSNILCADSNCIKCWSSFVLYRLFGAHFIFEFQVQRCIYSVHVYTKGHGNTSVVAFMQGHPALEEVKLCFSFPKGTFTTIP